jgi:membrane associated rhomboid family serine protease
MATARPLPSRAVLTTALIALNVAVYAWQVLVRHMSPFGATSDALLAAGGNAPFFTLAGEPWRLLTSMFLHGNLLHLALNMLALRVAGARAEEEFGAWRTLLVYLGGGLLASCASALWSAHRLLPLDAVGVPVLHAGVSVGASGAVLALFGGLLAAALFALPTVHDRDPRPMLDRPLLQVIALNIVCGFAMPGIDQAAHVGGTLAGFVVGALLALGRGRGGPAVGLLRALACIAVAAGGIAFSLHWAAHNGVREVREDADLPIRVLPLPPPLPLPAPAPGDDERTPPAEHV